jgi:hypothetical protein
VIDDGIPIRWRFTFNSTTLSVNRLSTARMPVHTWSPTSWRERPIKQDVVYPEDGQVGRKSLSQVLDKLRKLPPLVTAKEVRLLLLAEWTSLIASIEDRKASLTTVSRRPCNIDTSLTCCRAEVAQGRAFLLQGGDCAETFGDCSQVLLFYYSLAGVEELRSLMSFSRDRSKLVFLCCSSCPSRSSGVLVCLSFAY